jgi:hypothetical protein
MNSHTTRFALSGLNRFFAIRSQGFALGFRVMPRWGWGNCREMWVMTRVETDGYTSIFAPRSPKMATAFLKPL